MCIHDDRPKNPTQRKHLVKRTTQEIPQAPSDSSCGSIATTSSSDASTIEDQYSQISSSSRSDVAQSISPSEMKISNSNSSSRCSSKPNPNLFSTNMATVLAGAVVAFITNMFSVYFPFMMAPHAASQTYHMSFWKYDESLSHFDNTVWTYGTDYGVSIVMGLIAVAILCCDQNKTHALLNITKKLRYRSAGLLLMYTASVLAGAVAHQTYLTLDSRNTISFRILWTICVGTVCAASGFMGCIATEMARRYAHTGPIPIVDETFWISYGVVMTIICVLGGLSYQRPACDIFIAGTTQLPSTAYIIALFVFQFNSTTDPSCLLIRLNWRVIGCIGFILMAPTLPAYPLLVQYTDWELGSVNALLHTNLLLAWSMQGLSMKHIISSLSIASSATSETSKSHPAVPVPATLYHHIPSTLPKHQKQS